MMSPRLKSVVPHAWVVFALVIGTLLTVRGLGRINAIVAARPVYDLVVDWKGARAFVDGYNPYSPEGQARAQLTATGNGHPPTTFFWIIPLASSSLPVARQTLLELDLLLIFIELVLIAHEFRVPSAWPTAWLALGLVLCCDWIDFLFYLGQLSQLIAFTYFLAWYCLRRGWDARSGLAVGAACTLKVYPGVLLLLLLLGRRWRALAAAAALYVMVAVIMTSRFGVASWFQFAGQLAGVADQWMASIQNQAIHGFVLRFFRPTCQPRGGTLPVATAISTIGSLALLSGAAWLSRRAVRAPTDAPSQHKSRPQPEARGQVPASPNDRIDLPFALAAVLSVFTSNWAWEHYNVLYILPLAIVLASIPRVGSWGFGPRWSLSIAALFAAAVGTLAVPILKKAEIQNAYVHHPELHFRLHFFEALNMVPVLSLITALGLLLWMRERRPSQPHGA